ncbi:Arm DNA-binding domain-containing protein [Lactococcus fujiensis]|uniref:Arm DNA-binding domain-containing protein n=1 Tax=Lactococcus fujiensis TaxID=610251 RepID=UPI002092A9EE|nr:Arm DNA-binding domain-containing protein [Lactococcus fujiensis]
MATYQKRGKYWQYSISRSKLGLQRLTKGGFTTKSEAQAEAMEIESKIKKRIFCRPFKTRIC